MLVKVSGLLAMAGSFLILFGLAKQILVNYNRGRVEGLSSVLIVSAFYTYAAWAVHRWAIKSLYLAITQTIGTLLSFVLLLQWLQHLIRQRRRARR